MSVLDRLKKNIESYTPRYIKPVTPETKSLQQTPKTTPSSKQSSAPANLPNPEQEKTRSLSETPKSLNQAMKRLGAIDRSTPNSLKLDLTKSEFSANRSPAKLIENWSLYMTNMGSHFKQIAEESLFRSQYLSVSAPDPVCFLFLNQRIQSYPCMSSKKPILTINALRRHRVE
jgi:type IV secretory pathway VirB10-like protein